MKRIHLEHNGVVIRKQPPIVGDYCKVPSSGKVNEPCVYASATCRGGHEECQRCGFRYCDQHYPTHVRGFIAPPDVWRSFLRRLWASLDTIAENPRRRVHVGPVSIDEDA